MPAPKPTPGEIPKISPETAEAMVKLCLIKQITMAAQDVVVLRYAPHEVDENFSAYSPEFTLNLVSAILADKPIILYTLTPDTIPKHIEKLCVKTLDFPADVSLEDVEKQVYDEIVKLYGVEKAVVVAKFTREKDSNPS